MTDEATNETRAERAQAALDAYIEFTGDAPDESHFRDLLCDLMHLADRDGAGDGFIRNRPGENLTFDEAFDMAHRCFEDEKAEVEELSPGTTVVTMVGPVTVGDADKLSS
jgi:hypothetical protein